MCSLPSGTQAVLTHCHVEVNHFHPQGCCSDVLCSAPLPEAHWCFLGHSVSSSMCRRRMELSCGEGGEQFVWLVPNAPMHKRVQMKGLGILLQAALPELLLGPCTAQKVQTEWGPETLIGVLSSHCLVLYLVPPHLLKLATLWITERPNPNHPTSHVALGFILNEGVIMEGFVLYIVIAFDQWISFDQGVLRCKQVLGKRSWSPKEGHRTSRNRDSSAW